MRRNFGRKSTLFTIIRILIISNSILIPFNQQFFSFSEFSARRKIRFQRLEGDSLDQRKRDGKRRRFLSTQEKTRRGGGEKRAEERRQDCRRRGGVERADHGKIGPSLGVSKESTERSAVSRSERRFSRQIFDHWNTDLIKDPRNKNGCC